MAIQAHGREGADLFRRMAAVPAGRLPGLMLRAQDISLKRCGAPGTLCARSMTIDEQLDMLMGGTAVVISREELKERLKLGRPLRVKLGVDPTAPDIHLGHTVAIEKLRQFQELGHQAVLLIGDFTATIGDPSGRSVTRPPLSREQVLANAETYTKQAFKILDRDKTEIVYNGDWFRKMSYEEVLKLNARVTMQQMLAREDFKARMESGKEVRLHEIQYPIMQGWDSVEIRADVELGGTDQLFNILVGRDLQKEQGMMPQIAMTMPLLEGLDGVRKMSKSYGNYIGIDEPPAEIFGKVMGVSDELMWRYYELLSAKSLEEIAALKRDVAEGRVHPKAAKEALAHEMVSRYHSGKDADEARQGFNAVFADGGVPADAPSLSCQHGEDSTPPAFLEAAGLVKSRGEAKRLIKEGALSVDGQRCDDALAPLPAGDYVIKLGKKRFLKLNVR